MRRKPNVRKLGRRGYNTFANVALTDYGLSDGLDDASMQHNLI